MTFMTWGTKMSFSLRDSHTPEVFASITHNDIPISQTKVIYRSVKLREKEKKKRETGYAFPLEPTASICLAKASATFSTASSTTCVNGILFTFCSKCA